MLKVDLRMSFLWDTFRISECEDFLQLARVDRDRTFCQTLQSIIVITNQWLLVVASLYI